MSPPRPPGGRGPLLVLMTIVMVWSGALAVGLGFAAVASADLGIERIALYGGLSAFTALLAVTTGYEMFRRIFRPHR